MKKVTILAIFAVAVVAMAGYVISGTDQCLSQPSVTEVSPTRLLISVYHEISDGDCDCNHDTNQTTGDIVAKIYNSSDVLLSTASLDYKSTTDCYEYWERTADYSGGARYVIFDHVASITCETRVNL